MKSLYIHAYNIHQGGGQTLLHAILKVLPSNLHIKITVDSRLNLQDVAIPSHVQIRQISPTILQRFKTEWWLKSAVTSQDIVLCFGNLPPLFKLQGHVIVFLQNRYLIDKFSLASFSFKHKLRLSLERLFFYLNASKVNQFIVQTSSMVNSLKSKIKTNIPVQIMPFVAVRDYYLRKFDQRKEYENKYYDFLYIASGDGHKNHYCLINAWCLLSKEGLFPSLCLTVPKINSYLCEWIEKIKNEYNLNIVNFGSLSQDEIKNLYKKTHALIYPSLFESLGLPLIEARQEGLKVVASELDYVRDVLDPDETFDPQSPRSIARAVKRLLKHHEEPLPLLSAEDFLKRILESVEKL